MYTTLQLDVMQKWTTSLPSITSVFTELHTQQLQGKMYFYGYVSI